MCAGALPGATSNENRKTINQMPPQPQKWQQGLHSSSCDLESCRLVGHHLQQVLVMIGLAVTYSAAAAVEEPVFIDLFSSFEFQILSGHCHERHAGTKNRDEMQ